MHHACLMSADRASAIERLILIQTREERLTLTRIVRLLENIDCGPTSPKITHRSTDLTAGRRIAQHFAKAVNDVLRETSQIWCAVFDRIIHADAAGIHQVVERTR